MPKKMYVVQADDGMFYCGMKYWDKQIRKAKIYHSMAFAEYIAKAYEECNCKILEVSLTIVPETKTNADRIRAMTDEELADFISNCGCYDRTRYCIASCKKCALIWLQQPAEGD